MGKNVLLFILFLGSYFANGQCLTNSLVINTGYDPITGLAITPGINGGTPVIDPHWFVTFETPSIAAALTPGLIEVVPGANADVITPITGSWIADPVGTPGGWISCLNSNTYNTDGTGPSGTPYNMKLTRRFRMCATDNIRFDFYIANDNYISAIDVDGILTTFSQPPIADPANFSSFSHWTQTFVLTAGVHNVNVIVHNYNDVSTLSNPTGMEIYGTVSSVGSINSLVSETYASCASYSCVSACNAVSLVDSLHPCAGDLVVLPASLIGTDSVLSITWSPATGLSSTTILAPTLTAGAVSSYYDITVRSLIPFNLVSNGDFSGGNTGFTSSYTYASGPSSVLLEGDYSVYNNPFSVHSGFTSFGDHTTGTGQMMIINGGPVATDVWCETIPVLPNTDYDFSAWIANCSSVTVGPDVPILQFKINGILIGVPTSITTAPGIWTNFFSVWNSGVSTTATICIYDLNTTPSGNDFALDDISFREICVAKDSVFIDIKVPDTTSTNKDTILCVAAAPLTLNATPGYTSYLWNTLAVTTFINVASSGTYWVYNQNHCSVLIDTFHVNFIPLPVVNLGNDTAFCIGNTLLLSSPQPPGTTYQWSDGSTATTLTVSASGTYWLRVDNGYCNATDTIHVLISPPPGVDLGPDIFNCNAAPVTLSSSITYTSPTYLWIGGTTLPTLTVPVTGTYWLQVTVGGCSSADTIKVAIIYDTFTLYNIDTAVCKGFPVQAIVTAYPSATFQWLPTAGVAAANTPSPLITPDTSSMYYVHVYVAGCPDLVDSFYIDVQPTPGVYLGGNQSVCKFDTLHLHASVMPAWYTHYSYGWSPATYLDDPNVSSVVFTAGDSMKLVLTVTTPHGCTGIDSALIVVFPGNFAKLDTTVNLCPRDSAQLTARGGTYYRWHPGMYLSDSTAAAPWVFPVTSQSYSVVVTSQYGCKDTVNASVVVRPAARIFLGDSVTIYPGESYHIKPQTNCVSFAWYPAAGLNDHLASDPIATPLLSTKYVVYGQTEWGCKTVDSISIYFDISSLLALPNAFTPGGSVNNKLYLIKRGEATLNYFRVFNRWGNLVFETKDIDEGWDGTFNGKPQPYDVYVYQVEAVTNTGKLFQKHGNVTLVR